jgi:CheY-like chemotaxis protein
MPASAAISRNVLIVDDELLVGQLVASLIKRVGYIPVVVQSARVALEVAANQALGLVITDLQMPDRNGLSLCRDLRASHPHLPVIAMSGSGPLPRNDDLQAALKAGARGTVAKPFKLDEFYSTVAHALGTPNL